MIFKKHPLKSVTLWAASAVFASPYWPAIEKFIREEPKAFCFLVGVLFFTLRFKTTQPVGKDKF